MTLEYPLGKVTTPQLQALAKVLWSWFIYKNTLCKTPNCSWSRSTTLSRYFEFFKISTSGYKCNIVPGQSPGLSSYNDLFRMIEQLKSSPELSKAELLEKFFTDRPTRPYQERALNLAVQVVMMINCSVFRQSSVLLEYGNEQARWHLNDTFLQFLNDVFPKTFHPSIDEIKSELLATKLKKNARLEFRPTDDLRNHLRLDRKLGVVEIFHHTAFLKEQLRLTKEQPQSLSVSDLIRIGGLPRALVIEVLDSIQKILFPLADVKTKELLLSLTSPSTCNFDTDMLRYESASIRNPEEQNIQYHYFGARLADPYRELINPTPRGLEKWFERKSSPRFVMMATIAGVMFAIFLGLLSLALGGFQAYVGYMAWKHPVQISTGSQQS
ncbi:uncharacterized protein EAF02_007235 [Botrytis sinoallii]|uniref:uncharacterized protein n=1 Tax=Botrytis sinoallii TaxID=1463999 RepID=UPI0018FF4901|nr:uncharacterized protein EAF02_007235 [Botrytis sinoallii]KAF7880389.1 hypothetical protein EAF02_007235 [Botrytis sinoallii]